MPRTTIISGVRTLAAMFALAACGGAPNAGSGSAAATMDGERLGIGRTASAAEIARWDHDISMEGAELPSGSGTVAQGAELYKAQCASCHNVNGEGLAPAYPALIGRAPEGEDFRFASDPKLVRTIGNYWSHAPSLFDYIKRAMPLTAPGSLSDDEVYALTAYLLAMNDVIARDATLDAESLRAVKMPYADRFVNAHPIK